MNGVAGRHCIHALKARAARKVPCSSSYRKLRKTYCHRVAEDIKHELQSYIKGSKADNILLYPASKRLEAELGIGATQGIMPDFSDETALYGYSLQHFGRTRLLFDLITQTQPDWLETRVRELFYTRSNSGGMVSHSPCIDLISLGGGPGYDYVTAAILSDFCSGPDINTQIFEALGWDGDEYRGGEMARAWLRSKGNSIEGGTSEVQLNIVAKRVLGLPDA